MNLEQLKSELKEKEKEIKDLYYVDGKCIFNDKDISQWKAPNYEILKAEISALKKGISACEEILNSQQKTTKLGESVLANKNEYSFDLSSPKSYDECFADSQTLIQQAEKQRDKEILEVTNGR